MVARDPILEAHLPRFRKILALFHAGQVSAESAAVAYAEVWRSVRDTRESEISVSQRREVEELQRQRIAGQIGNNKLRDGMARVYGEGFDSELNEMLDRLFTSFDMYEPPDEPDRGEYAVSEAELLAECRQALELIERVYD